MSNYHDLKPDDFDYPMSYAFRSFVEEQCTGKPLPPIDLPAQREAKPLFRPRPVDAEIDQLEAGFLFLQNKLNKHLDKKRGKY